MSTKLQYGDLGAYFIHEEDQRKPAPLSWPDVKPQYVHHVAPEPPPEISCSIPQNKDVKQRCVKFTVAAAISLLLLLLLAGILLAYYFSSSCMHGMRCGDGSCVWESQWCDGVPDCPAGQDEANCVRLCGSSFLLQIYWSRTKSWRTVCSHGWTDQQGRASCQHIGYSQSAYFKSGQYQAESDDGFLMVKSGISPQAPILRQLVLSNTCPNNSVVTLRCTDCGGRVNSSRSWPWQVSLQVEGSHRCGGAIISPSWIVTAAHCVLRASSPADWAVYAGIVDPLDTFFKPSYSVSRIIAHEGYDSLTGENDVALMRLSTPLDSTASSGVGPVCLPNVGLDVAVPQSGWTTLFGRGANGDALSLMEVQVALIGKADCNSSLAYNGRISQDMLCARATQAGSDTCHTDSGAPLVMLRDGLWWLLGDSIRGETCTKQNKPGVYGNVTYFLDWIYRHMKVKEATR